MFLYVSAVGFDETIYDTEDLSTVRGGSLLCEDMGKALAKHLGAEDALQESAAARGVLRFATQPADLETRLADFAAKAPWRHLNLRWGIGDTLDAARAQAATRRFAGWSVPDPREDAERPDALDQTRPATRYDENRDRWLSPSVADRRAYGLGRRAGVLNCLQEVDPCSDFHQLVAVDYTGWPMVVRDKLAVIRLDGMGGGALSKARGDRFPDDMAAFRERMKTAIEAWLEAENLLFDGPHRKRPHFEMLMWGGDDLLFVMPAIHALSFLRMILTEADKPFAEGMDQGFPHRAGCIIAQVKTPIRQLKRLAAQSEDSIREGLARCKLGPQSAFAIDVFESLAPSYAGVLAARRALYGPDHDPHCNFFLASEIDALVSRARQITEAEAGSGHLSSSQLHRVLDAVRQAGEPLDSQRADDIVRDLLNGHFTRRGISAPDWIDQPSRISTVLRRLPVLLAELAQLRPYLPPAGQP